MNDERKRRMPPRPASPNSKGLIGALTLPVKLMPNDLRDLRARARYETMRWRLEHNGKGRAISAQDIVRRLVASYFRREPAIPNDAIGRAVSDEPR
jgi:hypothetical protein